MNKLYNIRDKFEGILQSPRTLYSLSKCVFDRKFLEKYVSVEELHSALSKIVRVVSLKEKLRSELFLHLQTTTLIYQKLGGILKDWTCTGTEWYVLLETQIKENKACFRKNTSQIYFQKNTKKLDKAMIECLHLQKDSIEHIYMIIQETADRLSSVIKNLEHDMKIQEYQHSKDSLSCALEILRTFYLHQKPICICKQHHEISKLKSI